MAAVRSLEPLRARLRAHPDEQSALALAQGYLGIGRVNSDPRFVSYAQATLAPWIRAPHPGAAVLTLEATNLQYLHRFDEALALLDRALLIQPLDGQAWLTKATLLQVQGRFTEAHQACLPLLRASGQLIALTCLTGVASVTGHLSDSYAALREVYPDDERLPDQMRTWILGQLADMAERSGDAAAAEDDLVRALDVSKQDPYLKAAYADLLLRQHRDAQVIQLLKADEQQDNLLLRLAIAGSRLHSPEANRWSNSFQDRYEAARRDGDSTHLREQARFLLDVRGRADQALELARQNWQIQREPADVRIYVAAALARGDLELAKPVLDWIHQTHYEDRTLSLGPAPAHEVARR